MKPVMYKEDVKDIIFSIIGALLGLGLSVLFIVLYNRYHNLIVTIITAIISIIFMVISLIIMMEKDIKIKWLILVPLVFFTIIFLFLFFVRNKEVFQDPKILLDCLMYSIYMLPSFIVVFIVVILLVCGLDYI